MEGGGKRTGFSTTLFLKQKHFSVKIDFFERFFFKITFVKIELYDVYDGMKVYLSLEQKFIIISLF